MALAYPLTVRNAFDDLLLLLGIETANNAPMYIRERVLTDMNATLALIQSMAGHLFLRVALTQATVSGTASYALPAATQEVAGPVRIGSVPLRQLKTRGEYDLFEQCCLGTAAAANNQPLAYYVQQFYATPGATGDNTALTLFLAPTPDAIYSVIMEVVNVAATVAYADLTDATKLIPIINAYVPSVFLPIARYNTATSPWFNSPERLPAIQADYARALALIGVKPPGTFAINPPQSAPNAPEVAK